ncbi:Uncharacterised protein [Leclercia adecarboxylata]|uniref:Uncharacterized protein n=1 Tax=Leclercia adecarboxylata TaxID=83655 RepID=A0A4U9IUE0_9ENTR|nr:Uncharacterised protein [Leclercia adecarboxylata]
MIPPPQQRTGRFDIHLFRERNDPLPVGAQFVSETAVVQNGWGSPFKAVNLVAADTGIAVPTAPCSPADAHALTNLQPFILGSTAQSNHAANHFVSGNQWVLRKAPFVIDHRQIGMADPAVIDLDFNVFCFQLARIVFVQLKFCTRLRCGVAFYL